MSNRIKPIAVVIIIIVFLLAGCSQKEANQNDQSTDNTYNNPIDAFFIPRIESSPAEAERRDLQDTYRSVWKSEYKNVIVWLTSKCQYQADIDKLAQYTVGVEELITSARAVMLSEWLNVYDKPPDSPDRNSWGNGTRSGLNQIAGEIYRNSAILLIEHCEGYEYRDIDYSQERYE
ncbi:MAG: hypothetical protein LBR98_07155 [Syntrophomonadaceae bacterium]|jgi:hypothetical protein|nr:hypothetical protein [Syntrophomonadaceae bacterium]